MSKRIEHANILHCNLFSLPSGPTGEKTFKDTNPTDNIFPLSFTVFCFVPRSEQGSFLKILLSLSAVVFPNRLVKRAYGMSPILLCFLFTHKIRDRTFPWAKCIVFIIWSCSSVYDVFSCLNTLPLQAATGLCHLIMSDIREQA